MCLLAALGDGHHLRLGYQKEPGTNLLPATKEATLSSQSANKARRWGGRVVTALPILGLLMSAAMKLSHDAQMVPQFVEKFGYPESSMGPIGLVELVCTILYAVPKT